MNVKDGYYDTIHTLSFADAGLVPGQSKSNYSTAIGRMMFGNPNIGTNSDMSVAVGDSAKVGDNGKKSVALGYNANVYDYDAQGDNHKTTVEESVAIGANSSVSRKESIAVGSSASVDTKNAIAIGSHSQIKSGAVNSIAIGGLTHYDGEDTDEGGYSIDYMVEQDAKDSIVIGTSGLSQSAGATIVGTGARVEADADHSAAFGEDSEVRSQDIEDGDKKGVVSFGISKGNDGAFTRRLINVSDGIKDTDAATVGQLNKVGTTVTNLNGSAVKLNDNKTEADVQNAALTNVGDIKMRINYSNYSFTDAGLLPGQINDSTQSTSIGADSQVTGNYSTAIGNNSAAAANALAIGTYANAADNSVVLGSGDDSNAAPKAGRANSVAIGTYVDVNSANATAIGYGAQIGWNGKNAVALGADSVVNEENVVSFGHKKGESNGLGGTYGEDLNRRLTNVAAGTGNTDAVNVGQLTQAKDELNTDLNNMVNTKIDGLVNQLSKNGAQDQANGLILAKMQDAGIIAGTNANGGDNTVISAGSVVENTYQAIALGNGAKIQYGNDFGQSGDIAIGVNSAITYDAVENPAEKAGWYLGHNMAIGQNARNQNSNFSVALGTQTLVRNSDYSVALGASSDALDDNMIVSLGWKTGNTKDPAGAVRRRVVHVMDGINDTDAATVGQTVHYKQDGTEDVIYTTSKGRQVTYKKPKLDYGTIELAGVEQNGINVGTKITNLAAGTSAKDAVNYGQFAGKENSNFLNAVKGIDWNTVSANADAINAAVNNLNTQTTASIFSLRTASFALASAPAASVADENSEHRNPTPTTGGITTDDSGNAIVNKGLTVNGDTKMTGKLDVTGDTTLKNTTVNGALKVDGLKDDVATEIKNNTSDIQKNSNAISSLGRSVNKLGDEVDSVGAISAALAGLHPLDYDPTNSKYQISAALGSYDGSSALAVGGFYNFNRDVLLSMGVSTVLKGERKTSGNVGITFRVGAGKSEGYQEATPGESTVSADILKRLAEMDQKISVLEQKNDKLEAENADQKKQLEALQKK